jgi:hypothetical protein
MTTTTTTATGDAAEKPRDPLSDFLGFGREQGPSDDDLAEERRVQDLVQSCMQAQGFTYTTIDPAVTASAPAPGPWSLPGDQFAATYGYGITTIDKKSFASPKDANADAVAAMSPSEKQAYYQALYGDIVTVDAEGNLQKRAPKDGSPPTTSGTKSCSQQASDEVYGATTETVPAANPFADLEREMSAMWDRIENDQRVVDAVEKWSGCMADAGHQGYGQLDAPRNAVNSRADQVLGPNRDQTADPQAIADLHAFEISVATADHACRHDYDSVHDEVTDEIETAFIDEHRDDLERYRDAIAAGTVGKG